jgi:hypothetical protein
MSAILQKETPPLARGSRKPSGRPSDGRYMDGGRALSVLNLECHLLALGQTLGPLSADR